MCIRQVNTLFLKSFNRTSRNWNIKFILLIPLRRRSFNRTSRNWNFRKLVYLFHNLNLLIAPVGIEILYAYRRSRQTDLLLIAPVGIEILVPTNSFCNSDFSFNRTSRNWNCRSSSATASRCQPFNRTSRNWNEILPFIGKQSYRVF